MITKDTKDINLGAFLWCQKGTSVKDTILSGRGIHPTVVFIFELDMTEDEYKELTKNYFNKNTNVEPRTFVDRQNDLKDILHSQIHIERKKDDR
jgi:hypothetical protein